MDKITTTTKKLQNCTQNRQQKGEKAGHPHPPSSKVMWLILMANNEKETLKWHWPRQKPSREGKSRIVLRFVAFSY